MPTAEQRYQMATNYTRRAMATVEAHGVSYTRDPITGIIEWYAGATKTAQPRAELSRIVDRWSRSTTDGERQEVARDAELLANRVEENLPGAPQDWARTNLYSGEQSTAAPATSYADEADRQGAWVWQQTKETSGDVWQWLTARAHDAEERTSHVGNWLLAVGTVAVAWKGLDYLRQREAGRRIEDALNASLAQAADSRNARTNRSYYVRAPDTNLYFRVVRDNGGRRALLVPLSDEARDAIASSDVVPFTASDGSSGEAFDADITRYERVAKLPRRLLP